MKGFYPRGALLYGGCREEGKDCLNIEKMQKIFKSKREKTTGFVSKKFNSFDVDAVSTS